MSATYIPLEVALRDNRYRAILLENLRNGAITSYAAESFGANLIEFYACNTIEELIDKTFETKLERRVVISSLEEQNNSLRYLYERSVGYLAISQQPTEIVAFGAQSRQREGHCTLPAPIWQYAYIDERRDAVVYDDFEHLYRKEYIHVQIDSVAFGRLRRDCAQQLVTPVGRKSIYRRDVEDSAKVIVSKNPGIKLTEFLAALRAEFGDGIGSRNTVDEHYGDIWRGAMGRPLRAHPGKG